MAAPTPVSLAPAAAAAGTPTAAITPVARIGLPAVTDSLASAGAAAGAGAASPEELDKQANARRRLELTEQQGIDWDHALNLYQTEYGPGTQFAARVGADNLRADLQPYRELYLMSCMLKDVHSHDGQYLLDIQTEALFRSLSLASKDLLIASLNPVDSNRLGSRINLLTYCSDAESMHTLTAVFLKNFTAMKGNDDSKQAGSAAAGAGAG